MSLNKNAAEKAEKPSDTEFSDDPLKDKIGLSLRQMYDDVVNEPIPNEFLGLLAKADKNTTNADGADNESA